MLPLARRLEALLFISPRPIAADRLAEACDCSAEDAAGALTALCAEYAAGAEFVWGPSSGLDADAAGATTCGSKAG